MVTRTHLRPQSHTVGEPAGLSRPTQGKTAPGHSPGGSSVSTRGRGRGRSRRPNRRNTRKRRPAATAASTDTPVTTGPAASESLEQSSEASLELTLPQQITVHDLADLMKRSPIELIKELMNAGIMANINQMVDYDTAAIVAEDMGFKIKQAGLPEPELTEQEAAEAPVVPPPQRRVYTDEEQKLLRMRPPVVTILGHVDHGKTSLLDVIRESNVQAGEVGGITQAIGAYQVSVGDKAITFLDTPGHEAFTAMRARGASVTDIAVLVVAADDGVRPQTREALDHARAAGVPIIVAINKIDLATANVDRVKQQLSDLALVPEDWGGDTICVPVSAKTKEGISTMLDMILLVAELGELRGIAQGNAEGVVIEGRLDRSRGPMATLLLQEGVLGVGDAVVVGQSAGRIRGMFDYQGQAIEQATPSMPAVVMGLREVPEAGERFEVVDTARAARDLAEERAGQAQEPGTRASHPMSLDEIYAQAQAAGVQTLNLIVKTDVQGSLEPIKSSLDKLDVGGLQVKFIHQGVGPVAESDVMLAVASQAVVVGFNVGVDVAAQRVADVEGVDVRTYDIIYRLIEDVQLALTGLLEPEYADVIQGTAIVRQVFNISRVGTIAGSQVSNGKALRNAMARVKRGDQVLHDAQVSSLKRYTEDVREVAAGMECGIGVAGFSDYLENDVIEFYTRELVK